VSAARQCAQLGCVTLEEARAVEVAKRLAWRLERRTLEAHNTGFEAGFAAAVAAEARQSESRRRTVERDEKGRITAVIG
jgi:hypothetical protein